MGIDLNIYLGPYLLAIEDVIENLIDKCKYHNVPENALYCPECGCKRNFRYEKVLMNKISIPDDWEGSYFKGNFADFLFSTSFMDNPPLNNNKRTYIYLPNRYYKELNIPDLGTTRENEIPLDENLNIRNILDKFKNLFKDEIEYISSWFEIKVKFGFISYYS